MAERCGLGAMALGGLLGVAVVAATLWLLPDFGGAHRPAAPR